MREPALAGAAVARAFTAAALLAIVLIAAGCALQAPPTSAETQAGQAAPTTGAPGSTPAPRSSPAAVISDREGPSWEGDLGETVQIDWYDQTTGTVVSEQVAVLAVKRFADPGDDGGPDEFGDAYGPYEWKYGIKVRLTSLDARAARHPAAYQFLQLSDGRDTEDGVSGLGEPGGPDPSRPGRSSIGWLFQHAEQGFTPTQVTLPVGPWNATWSLD